MENNIVAYTIKKTTKRPSCPTCSSLLPGYMYGFNMVPCPKVSKLYQPSSLSVTTISFMTLFRNLNLSSPFGTNHQWSAKDCATQTFMHKNTSSYLNYFFNELLNIKLLKLVFVLRIKTHDLRTKFQYRRNKCLKSLKLQWWPRSAEI